MSTFRIAIAEDEMIIAGDIQDMLLAFGYEVCGIAISYAEALEIAEQEQPDLFILDINLNEEKSGVDLAIVLQNMGIPFIFATSHADKYTIESVKRTRPLSYLIKPFTQNDLYACIEIALSNQRSENTHNLYLPIGKNKKRIDIREIFYIQANGNYVELKIGNQRVALRKNLKEFESKLPTGHPFIRVHKSFLVNRLRVSSYSQIELKLTDNTSIPIGRTYLVEIKNLLNVI